MIVQKLKATRELFQQQLNKVERPDRIKIILETIDEELKERNGMLEKLSQKKLNHFH